MTELANILFFCAHVGSHHSHCVPS